MGLHGLLPLKMSLIHPAYLVHEEETS